MERQELYSISGFGRMKNADVVVMYSGSSD